LAGDERLGRVLRDLRRARKLTLGAVSRRAGCAESLLSYVETGRRHLHPWLAEQLDGIYQTGGILAALVHGDGSGSTSGWPDLGTLGGDVLLVRLPEGGALVPVSRRELLVGLSIGALGGSLRHQIDQLVSRLAFDADPLPLFERAFAGFQTAARTLPPTQIIDGLTGHVALLDALRHQAPVNERSRYAVMQARYAESLSWLSEEAGDLHRALYWTDRAAQWALVGNWPAMVAFTFVRRSMMAISFTSDGRRAVDTAGLVLDMPTAPARVKGLAAVELAMGHALAGDQDDSARALDKAMEYLAAPMRDDEVGLGQRSVVGDDLYTIYRTTCDIYLGRSDTVIPLLAPRLDAVSKGSARTATITRAKLARAYANAGHPQEACQLAWQTLDAIEQVGSLYAWSELTRMVPVLGYWAGRSDVQEITERLAR
jgi:hypothetical protein